ncbi:TLC domain-containing protein [Mariannaea sp. PMI_226]|nr:TLC domain-containing protein [Mariannaea sp. PMI_226]
MTDFGTHDTQPIVNKILKCEPTSVKLERSTSNTSHHLPPTHNYVHSVTNGNRTAVQHAKRTVVGTWRMALFWIMKNQIDLSFSLLALLLLAHLVPNAQPHTIKFFTLSYYNNITGKYRNGRDDVFLVSSLIILFTGLRATVIKYLLVPFAKRSGVRKSKDLTRFGEQSWLLCYYGIFWTIGMNIFYNSAYWLDLKELWTNWPIREITATVKFYILAQCAFWVQQIIVIHIEERRKDHWQMLAHHLITCGLIYGCYAYHQTRVGNLILVTMDFIDIILPLAKCLKYMGFKTLCDVVFGVFLVSWIFTRHIAYSLICWSIYADIPIIIGDKCWRGLAQQLQGPLSTPQGWSYLLEPFWEPEGLVCFGPTQQWLFLSPLLFLQVLNFVWLAMIARIALKVVRKEGAEDSRSDDDDDESVKKQE